MATAELINEHPETWLSGTRHYRTSDGQDFAVEANPTAPDGSQVYVDELLAVAGVDLMNTTLVLRPTKILHCAPDGTSLGSLDVLHEFPAGTTHAAALRLAGYEIT